jgi:hypothetical protein
MNFSTWWNIPWSDNDRKKLDLVAANVGSASAGNTSATIVDPVGAVAHLGPWVMTVAASTRDELSTAYSPAALVSPPANTQNIPMDKVAFRRKAALVKTIGAFHPAESRWRRLHRRSQSFQPVFHGFRRIDSTRHWYFL